MEVSISDYPELAPCGVFCGACPSFGKSCHGCGSEDRNQKRTSKWSCKIRICCYEETGLNFCGKCDDFPCNLIHKKLLKPHQGDPRFRYRRETLEYSPLLKTLPLQEYHQLRADAYKCPKCGGRVIFYDYKCKGCGEEIWGRQF